MTEKVYQRAWNILRERLAGGKTGWGKVELDKLMSQCFEQAVAEVLG